MSENICTFTFLIVKITIHIIIMNLRIHITLLAIAMSIIQAMTVCAARYGLRFMSHSVSGWERTTVELLNGEPTELGNTLKLSFIMDIRNESVFGNVLWITFDDGRTVSLFITPTESDETFRPTLMMDGKFQSIDHRLKNPNPASDIPVAITVNKQKNSITASFGGKESTMACDLSRCEAAAISIGLKKGKNGDGDVAPMDIRDVRVERDGQPLYFWEMRTHKGDITTDMLANGQATVTNGYWLQDSHTTWKKALEYHATGDIQYAYDARTHTFYITGNDSLVSWNAATGKLTPMAVTGHRAMPKSKYLYSNDGNGMLYSYNLEKMRMTVMNPGEGKWSGEMPETDDAVYYNHAVASHGGDTLFTFGGYGYYRFRNNLYMVNTATGKIEELKVASPPEPRTHAGMAWVGDKLYILGGYGNSSGRQEQAMEFYNDLWEIDLKTLKGRKLWEQDGDYKMSVASQLIYNAKERAFYAATVEKELIRFGIDEPGWQVVTKKIPVAFDFRVLNYGLYMDEKLERVFVVVDCLTGDDTHNLQICTVDLPLSEEAVVEEDTPADEPRSKGLVVSVVLALLAATGCALGLFIVAYKRKKEKRKYPFRQEENILQPALTIPPIETHYDKSVSEIKMLGEFAVFDKHGQNITAKFSSMSRNLLFVLMLSSTINKKGVENDLLDEILWKDKTKASARNNRNVYMSKMRALLNEIGDTDITSDKINSYVKIGTDVFFDFGEANRLMDAIGNGDINDEIVNRLLELLQRGSLLPTQSLVWLDSIKGNYSNRAISMLKSLAIRAAQQEDDTQLYHIAAAIMTHDPFNEDALAIQCKILYKRQAIGIAQHIYNKFRKTYEQSLGEPYTKSFNELCK